MLHSVIAATTGDVTKAGKAIALALGIGLGSLGAGIGIGNIFGSMIQSVARQPELRGELQGIQWLGFALTEAVVFYGLLGSILAYVPGEEKQADADRRERSHLGHAGADDLDDRLLRADLLRAQARRVRPRAGDDRR